MDKNKFIKLVVLVSDTEKNRELLLNERMSINIKTFEKYSSIKLEEIKVQDFAINGKLKDEEELAA